MIKPQGCGNSLDWSTMEDVTNEINKKLTKIETSDNKIIDLIEKTDVNHFI